MGLFSSVCGAKAPMIDPAVVPDIPKTSTPTTETNSVFSSQDAWQALQLAHQSVRQLNFDSTFVQIRGNQLTTYRWLHGLYQPDSSVPVATELERLVLQDGLGTETLRRADRVYYAVPNAPLAVTVNAFIRELPALLYLEQPKLQALYDAVLGSSIAISGRTAQLLRLTARLPGRYDYWVWLDAQSGFPLRIDTVDGNNQVLERWMIVHLQVKADLPAELQDVQHAELPSQPVPLSTAPVENSSFRLGWLPEGYHAVDQPQTVLTRSGRLLASWLLSDGMHQVSVFLQPTASNGDQVFRDGATTIMVMARQNYDVTVIGPLPLEQARQLAQAIE